MPDSDGPWPGITPAASGGVRGQGSRKAASRRLGGGFLVRQPSRNWLPRQGFIKLELGNFEERSKSYIRFFSPKSPSVEIGSQIV